MTPLILKCHAIFRVHIHIKKPHKAGMSCSSKKELSTIDLLLAFINKYTEITTPKQFRRNYNDYWHIIIDMSII